MRESKIEGYLRGEVAKLGGWMEKHVSPGTRGPPDNIVMWNVWPMPSFIEFIETKAPKEGPNVLQARDHARRRKMGVTVHVISTMEQAEAYLRLMGKR